MSERSLFLAALDIDDPSERLAYLDRACAGNAALRAQVEQLLKAHQQSGCFMEQPAAHLVATVDDPIRERPGKVIGPLSTSETPAVSKLCAFLSPSQAPDEIGRLGSYRVLKVLGAGGMGVVFWAEDPQLQRVVALKAMLPALAANESARQRFLREARAAASLKHDHIVTIHQVGEDRGAPFLAMEFLEGEALEDRVKREGKLPLAEVLRIGREIAEGLQAAHEHGLIHRDIKPANIWLEGKRGRVKILDFGLARSSSSKAPAHAPQGCVKILDFGLARSSSDDVDLTQSGTIVGTPAYMPPEQARGESVDARCDLYSLGCVLYRLCTGELPFKADNTTSLLTALAIEQPRSPREINPDVPPPLADLILRLLAKELAQRPATAGEVAESLQNLAVEKSPPLTVAASSTPPQRRRKFLPAAAAGAFLVAALLVVIVIRLGGAEEGTVTIKTVDPDVELVFTSSGKEFTIRDKKNGDEINLPLGSYQVALKGGKEGLKLETTEFTLKRGDRVLVKVTRQAGDKSAVGASDRRNHQPPDLVVESQGLLGTCDVLTFTHDGKHLLAVDDNKVVRVWEYRDGQLDPRSLRMLRRSVWGTQRGAIYALAVSPDPQGQRVAIGGVGIKSTAAVVIDRASGDILAGIYANDHPAAPKKGGFGSVRAITFSPRGDRIAFGSTDGSVWLWCYERKGKEELKWLGAHSRWKNGFNRVRLLHFLDERKLLSAAQNGEVFQWDVAADKQQPNRLKLLNDVSGPIHDVQLSRDGQWLAARAVDKPRIYVRSLDGKRRKDIALEKKTVAARLAFHGPERLAAGIRSTVKNDEGFYLESNDQVCLFDVSQKNARVCQGPPHSGRIDVLAFHPDGKHLAAAGGDNHEVTLWNLSRSTERPTVLRGGSGIWNVALSEGGRDLAFQTQRDPEPTHPNRRGRGSWTLFDLRRRQWASAPAGFTPAPKRETQDGWQVKPTKSAYTWHVERAGQGIDHKLPWDNNRQGMPRCYAFLPRRKGQPVRLAVGHYNGVSVFEVTEKNVRPIWQGMGHEGEVMSLAVSPKGDWMVSASDDQTISAWSLSDWPSGSELGARFGENENGQIVVEQVDFFGPAWQAGMSAGDRIFGLSIVRKVIFFRPKVNGSKSKVGSIEACLEALKHVEPGKPLFFRLERGRGEWFAVFTSVRRRPLWRFFPTRNMEWILWMGVTLDFAEVIRRMP